MSENVVSASLLKKNPKPGVASSYYHSFCLGIEEWCPCCIKMEESCQSLSLKRAHVNPQNEVESDKKKWNESSERFLFDTDADVLSKYKEGNCPRKTEKNTEWALRNFEAWQTNILKNSAPLTSSLQPTKQNCATGSLNLLRRLASLMEKNTLQEVFM